MSGIRVRLGRPFVELDVCIHGRVITVSQLLANGVQVAISDHAEVTPDEEMVEEPSLTLDDVRDRYVPRITASDVANVTQAVLGEALEDVTYGRIPTPQIVCATFSVREPTSWGATRLAPAKSHGPVEVDSLGPGHELAVGDNIDAAIELVVDNLRHCASDPPCVGVIVVDFALTFVFIISSRSFGPAKLPQWVVKIRSVLRFMVGSPFEFDSRTGDYSP